MPVIPELAVADPAAARIMLRHVFGFVEDGALMRLGDQSVAIVAGEAGHGTIDHLALAVPDPDAACAALLARGARLDASVTPDGPLEIPEFWTAGVRYVFLEGPDGARIELIANTANPHGPGHDHIGIPCSDIAASATFFAGLGASPMAQISLIRPEGETQVRFLVLQDSVLELYQPPVYRPVPGIGKWQRLLISGVTATTGPDGLTIAPL